MPHFDLAFYTAKSTAKAQTWAEGLRHMVKIQLLQPAAWSSMDIFPTRRLATEQCWHVWRIYAGGACANWFMSGALCGERPGLCSQSADILSSYADAASLMTTRSHLSQQMLQAPPGLDRKEQLTTRLQGPTRPFECKAGEMHSRGMAFSEADS